MRLLFPMLLLLGLLLPTRVQAGCPASTTVENVMEMVKDAQLAFSLVDLERFTTSRDLAIARLECLNEPMKKTDVAEFYAMVAFDAFLKKDEPALDGALRSIVAAEDWYKFSTHLVPNWHALHSQITRVRMDPPSPSRPVPELNGDRLMIDGALARVLPEGRPLVVQRLTGGLIVAETRFVDTTHPWPDWLLSPEDLAAVRTARLQRRLGFGLGTGAALAGTGVLTWLAIDRRAQADEPGLDPTEVNHLEHQAEVLTVGAVTSGLVAAGLGITLVVTW